MKAELLSAFSERVEKYRKTLVYYAKSREWSAFEKKAAELFDYVEEVEISEVERRFETIFKVILAGVIILSCLILKIDVNTTPEVVRKLVVAATLGGGGYEFFFFLNFRHYIRYKRGFRKKRRERFVRNIERDFRSY